MFLSANEAIVTLLPFPGEMTGFADDSNCIEIPSLELNTSKRGADGLKLTTPSGERGGAVTFRLMPNSPSVKILQNYVATALTTGQLFFNGTIRIPRYDFELGMSKGTLDTAPLFPTLGKGEVSNLEYTFDFELLIPNYSVAKGFGGSNG